jgi:hypothetical protein
MIKKFNDFVKESTTEQKEFNESFKPNEGKKGAASLTISNDDLSLFQTEGSLRNLITDEKISLIGNEVWYFEDDDKTLSVLINYFGSEEMSAITK